LLDQTNNRLDADVATVVPWWYGCVMLAIVRAPENVTPLVLAGGAATAVLPVKAMPKSGFSVPRYKLMRRRAA
jgi:hypothetical protein